MPRSTDRQILDWKDPPHTGRQSRSDFDGVIGVVRERAKENRADPPWAVIAEYSSESSCRGRRLVLAKKWDDMEFIAAFNKETTMWELYVRVKPRDVKS
jgi:hypothetical protein